MTGGMDRTTPSRWDAAYCSNNKLEARQSINDSDIKAVLINDTGTAITYTTSGGGKVNLDVHVDNLPGKSMDPSESLSEVKEKS